MIICYESRGRDVTLVILNSLRIKCHIRRPLTWEILTTAKPYRLSVNINVNLFYASHIMKELANFNIVGDYICMLKS